MTLKDFKNNKKKKVYKIKHLLKKEKRKKKPFYL